MTQPTFDEWHLSKYLQTFESAHMAQGYKPKAAFEALVRLMREYISDCVIYSLRK